MTDITPTLNLPLIQPSQAQKHVTHNEALGVLDALVQLCVEEAGLSVPPANPVEGARYIVGNTPGGDWLGEASAIALFRNGGWQFVQPAEGWRCYVRATGHLAIYRSGAWQDFFGDLNGLEGIGVQSSYDSINRLSIVGAASLFCHEGGSHQIKVNKAGAGDTASFLFQTGYSGRAEFGLVGSDLFSLKLSDDGTAWHTALEVDSSDLSVALSGELLAQAPVRLATYVKANLPSPSPAGGLVFVSDATGGAQPAWSDGSGWIGCQSGVAV